jgi:glycosyltransferase involved in cell wall biosynthesis
MNELVSVIVTNFNYSKYIGYCLRSIKEQTYEKIEVIVVDDGSTDNSVKILQSYEGIKLIALNKNMGYSHAKNEGIVNSIGDYLVVLDADDMLTANSIRSRVEAIQGYDIVHADAYNLFGEGYYTECYHEPEKFFRARRHDYFSSKITGLQWYNCIHAQTVMVKREVYKKIGLYDEDMKSKGDREMWHRILFDGFNLNFLNEFVAYYRIHPGQMSSSKTKNVKEVERMFLQKTKMRMNAINEENTRLWV